MKLPLSTDPFHGLHHSARIQVRSFVDPKVYNYLFRQLLPVRDVQSLIIAALLNKLYDELITRTDLTNDISTSDGSIVAHFEPFVPAVVASIIDNVNFRRDSTPASDDLRPASDCPNRPSNNGNVPGGTAAIRGTSSDATHVGADSPRETGEVVITSDNLSRLAQAIFPGSKG